MVGIYPRQSIFKKDSLSIEQQVQKCIDLCELNDWEYKVYDKDKGYSGKNLQRPSFIEMMDDVRAGKLDKILCYKFDRISRNISDFSALMVELQKYHCEFISLSENFDTTTPIGRAMVYICMVFAQMERENISLRVHDNYYYRTELGFWGGGKAPYGFRLKKVKYKGKLHTVLEPDETESEIVRSIFLWYLETSGSVSTILHKLNKELCIPTRSGSLWSSRVITDILTRPLYAPNDMPMYNYLSSVGADIKNPPEEFDGLASIDLYGLKEDASKHKRCRDIKNMYCNISNHEAIVDSDTWLRVQQKRSAMIHKPARSGTGRNSYFTGLMKCDICGSGVSYTNSRGTQGYYICSSRKNKGWHSCHLKPAPKKNTDPMILKEIISHYSDAAIIEQIKQARIESKNPSKKEAARRNAILAELATIQQKIDNLLSSIAEGNSTLIKYANDKIGELDLQKSELTRELNEIDVLSSLQKSEADVADCIYNMLEYIPEVLSSGDFDKIRETCRILVQEIRFKENGEIDVKCTI